MKLLPKSPLDSSPLGRGTGGGGGGEYIGYFEKSDPKSELFSEKEQRGRRVRETEKEPDASAYAKNR
jgi:hypothetical protein